MLTTTKHREDCSGWTTGRQELGTSEPQVEGSLGSGLLQPGLPASPARLWRALVGKKGSGRKQENGLLPHPMPLLQSVKQHEALHFRSLEPESLLQMKTKFSFTERGALLKATDHILSASGDGTSGEHNIIREAILPPASEQKMTPGSFH